MYKKTYLVFAAILTVLLLFGGTAAADEPADKSVLELWMQIAYEEGNDPNIIPASKEKLTIAINDAELVYANDDATQTEVDAAIFRLIDAIQTLFSAGDKTLLIALINECEVTYADESKFTPESWAAYQNALNTSKSIRDNPNALQDDVDYAYYILDDSRNNLRASADKTALGELIKECQIIANEGERYTPESLAIFVYDLNNAKSVYADNEATQTEVDHAYDSLRDSRDGLTLKWVPADKSALIALVTECETTYTDKNKYTQDSWNPYQDALISAYTVLNDDLATQAGVDAAYEALDNSRPELKKESGGNKNTGTGSGTGQATVVDPVNNSESVQTEAPGTSYSNTVEEQPDEEQNPKGVFLFPWLILLVLIIAGVIYCRNYRNSKEE